MLVSTALYRGFGDVWTGIRPATATLVGQAIGGGAAAEADRLGRRSVELLALLMLGLTGIILIVAVRTLAPALTLVLMQRRFRSGRWRTRENP